MPSLSKINQESEVEIHHNGIKIIKKNDNSTPSLNLKDLFQFKCNVYLLNKNGKLILSNSLNEDLLKMKVGESIQDIVDSNDSHNAEKIVGNNTRVINSREMVISDESVTIKTTWDKVSGLSIKIPLYNEQSNLCGIFGFSIIFNRDQVVESLIKINQLFCPRAKNIFSPFFYTEEEFYFKKALKLSKKTFLSKRQHECLIHLIKGMTYKEIAKSLNLSPKTVEHYIEAIKAKLNCSNRSEVIKQAFQLKLINNTDFLDMQY